MKRCAQSLLHVSAVLVIDEGLFHFMCLCKIANALTEGEAHSTWTNMYGPPSDCKEKAEGEMTSLRKCIRLLVELSAPGQDELRAYLSLLVGRLSSTNSSSRFPGTPL
jgi:hypothetical protein